MKQLLFALQLLTLLPSAHAEFTGGLKKLELTEPTEIDGIPCKHEALLYPDGHLEGPGPGCQCGGTLFRKGVGPTSTRPVY